MIHSAYRAAFAALALGMVGCGASEASPAVPLASASPEEPLPPTDDSGQLAILCNPPTPVLVDGKKAGTTPINGYRVPRINEAPVETHIHIVTSDAPPAGIGEPGVPPTAPALGKSVEVVSPVT